MRWLKTVAETASSLLAVAFCAFALVWAMPGQSSKPWLPGDMPQAFWLFLKSAITGDFGTSMHTHRPVSEEFLARLPATLELGALAVLWAVVAGIALGTMAAWQRGSLADHLCTGVSVLGYALPVFFVSIMLILIFSVSLAWTPVSGRINIDCEVMPRSGALLIDTLHPSVLRAYGLGAFGSAWRHLILPAGALGLMPMAVIAKTTRASMLRVLEQAYMRAAQARGLHPLTILLRYGLRNALTPVITVAGTLLITSMVTGTLLVETIFGWPGVGSYILSSLNARDYPVMRGSVLWMGAFVVVFNALTQRLYTWADPKLRSLR